MPYPPTSIKSYKVFKYIARFHHTSKHHGSASFPFSPSTNLHPFLIATQNKNRANNHRRLPGPKGLPFIGNIHQIDISNVYSYLTKLSHQYGPLLSLKLCQSSIIVISSASVAKQALKDNDVAFSSRPHTTTAFRFSYGGNDIITAPYSEYWREMRKMVVLHLFTPQKVRSFRPVREDEVSRLVDEISRKDDVINVGEMVSCFSCSVLCRVAFGKRLDESGGFDRFMKEFAVAIFETFLEDYFPLFRWVNKISGAASRVDNLFEEFDSFYEQLIEEHVSANRHDSMKNDILAMLIQLKEDNSAPVKIDWKHIKALLMNVFTAGTDTSAVTIIWAMTALMKKPEALNKVQKEIRSLVGMKKSVDEDDVEKLSYLKAVVKETMRLYPAVPLVPKQTIGKCIIEGYDIKPNTMVLVNIRAIGRDPEYWENANEFFPERFLNTSINFKGQDLGYIPFGSGRRICPGMHQGMATVELALANLLYSFDWEILTEKDIDTDASAGLVMHKKNPLCLKAKSYVSN